MAKKEKKQRVQTELSFLQQLSLLPEAMMRRFFGQFIAVLLIVALTVFLMIHFKTWRYCIGFLIALYIAYLAMDMVWGYQKGKIECRRMVCIKSQYIPVKERLFIIMRDEGSTESTKENTRQFYLSTTRKNAALITPQTVLDVYFRPDNPLEITAWEIVGNNGTN